MTPEQQQLATKLMIDPRTRVRGVSKEEFSRLFPSALEGNVVATSLIQEACDMQDADDLECALLIGFVFAFKAEQNHMFCELMRAPWHHSHEDIVSILEEIGMADHETVETLYWATQFSPSYMMDEARAMAVKAIWALGKIKNKEAEDKLLLLTKDHDSIVRENAMHQLERRAKGEV